MTHIESCWQESVLSLHASNFYVLLLLHYIDFHPGMRVKMTNCLYLVMFLNIDLLDIIKTIASLSNNFNWSAEYKTFVFA